MTWLANHKFLALQWVLLVWLIFQMIRFNSLGHDGDSFPTSRCPRHPQGPLASLCLKFVHAEELSNEEVVIDSEWMWIAKNQHWWRTVAMLMMTMLAIATGTTTMHNDVQLLIHFPFPAIPERVLCKFCTGKTGEAFCWLKRDEKSIYCIPEHSCALLLQPSIKLPSSARSVTHS